MLSITILGSRQRIDEGIIGKWSCLPKNYTPQRELG